MGDSISTKKLSEAPDTEGSEPVELKVADLTLQGIRPLIEEATREMHLEGNGYDKETIRAVTREAVEEALGKLPKKLIEAELKKLPNRNCRYHAEALLARIGSDETLTYEQVGGEDSVEREVDETQIEEIARIMRTLNSSEEHVSPEELESLLYFLAYYAPPDMDLDKSIEIMKEQGLKGLLLGLEDVVDGVDEEVLQELTTEQLAALTVFRRSGYMRPEERFIKHGIKQELSASDAIKIMREKGGEGNIDYGIDIMFENGHFPEIDGKGLGEVMEMACYTLKEVLTALLGPNGLYEEV